MPAILPRRPGRPQVSSDDLAVGDLDLLPGQRAGRRAGDHRAGGDREPAAVAGAVDGAAGHPVDDAAHVRAHRAERPVLAPARLGHDDPGRAEDVPPPTGISPAAPSTTPPDRGRALRRAGAAAGAEPVPGWPMTGAGGSWPWRRPGGPAPDPRPRRRRTGRPRCCSRPASPPRPARPTAPSSTPRLVGSGGSARGRSLIGHPSSPGEYARYSLWGMAADSPGRRSRKVR